MKREVLWAWSVQLAFLLVVTAGTDVPEDAGIQVRSKCGSLPTELHAVTHETTVKSGFDSLQGRQEFPFPPLHPACLCGPTILCSRCDVDETIGA
jgi:hypothetical protein